MYLGGPWVPRVPGPEASRASGFVNHGLAFTQSVFVRHRLGSWWAGGVGRSPSLDKISLKIDFFKMAERIDSDGFP